MMVLKENTAKITLPFLRRYNVRVVVKCSSNQQGQEKVVVEFIQPCADFCISLEPFLSIQKNHRQTDDSGDHSSISLWAHRVLTNAENHCLRNGMYGGPVKSIPPPP